MATASISEAKAKLSALLERVKAGETVTITDRGVPVAQIVPLNGAVRGRLGRAAREARAAGRDQAAEAEAPPGGSALALRCRSSREACSRRLLEERREDDTVRFWDTSAHRPDARRRAGIRPDARARRRRHRASPCGGRPVVECISAIARRDRSAQADAHRRREPTRSTRSRTLVDGMGRDPADGAIRDDAAPARPRPRPPRRAMPSSWPPRAPRATTTRRRCRSSPSTTASPSLRAARGSPCSASTELDGRSLAHRCRATCRRADAHRGRHCTRVRASHPRLD